MKLYEELFAAQSETISATEESNEFKTRFSKLIENYYDSSYAESDINDVIGLIGLAEKSTNGN